MDGMEPSDSTKDLKEKLPHEEEERTFDFDGLPWLIQKRFAEVCDPSTLKTFARINPSTRRLAKRCHVVDKVKINIDDSTCKYTILCYCNGNELCHYTGLSSIKKKIEITDKLRIINRKVIIDIDVLQNLPVSFTSMKNLELFLNCIELDAMNQLITPQLKTLALVTGIHSNCSLDDFVNFIESLSKLDSFYFSLDRSTSSLSFDYDALLQRCWILQSRKLIHYCNKTILFFCITKNY